VWRSNGSLYQRIDGRDTGLGDDFTDMFHYDNLERLKDQTTTVGASRTLNFSYDLYGDLTSKTSTVAGDLNATSFAYGTSS